MFKKLLAMAGIGAARVDCRLHNDVVVPGETLSGEIHIRGGEVEQEIDQIYLHLVKDYKREINDNTVWEQYALASQRLSERFTIQPNEERVLPFRIVLPYTTPLTIGSESIYLKTGLDIASAVDPKDKDMLRVQPHPLQQQFFNAVETLGFQLYRAQSEYAPRLGRGLPFVQEFEFRPSGQYRSMLEELEAVFYLNEHSLEVLLELDRRKRGFGGFLDSAFEMNERRTSLQLNRSDLERTDLPQRLDNMIRVGVRM